MAEAPPAQAPALEEEDPATRFWSNEDLVLRAFVRAPFVTHGTLHAVNHRRGTVSNLSSDRTPSASFAASLGWSSTAPSSRAECEAVIRSPSVGC